MQVPHHAFEEDPTTFNAITSPLCSVNTTLASAHVCRNEALRMMIGPFRKVAK